VASRKVVSSAVQSPPLKPEPLLLNIPEVAHMLSSSVWTVRGLLWNNEIPHIKIGRRFLVDPADLRAFIQRKKAEAVSA
jgi:excisionase family DNA binding protein